MSLNTKRFRRVRRVTGWILKFLLAEEAGRRTGKVDNETPLKGPNPARKKVEKKETSMKRENPELVV